jgi:hypothetical protein
MNRRAIRAAAVLMGSMAFTVIVLILGATATVYATNCCQDCEAFDAACGGGCEIECNSESAYLEACYASCLEQSDACWGIQGQGRYCTYCTSGGEGFSFNCWYECWVAGGLLMCEVSNGCGYFF